jgi:branched-chain amino acid transport system substrate-binding protein
MNLQRTVGLSLIAIAFAATYGCGKKEEPKKEEPKKAEAPAAAPAETVVKIGHVGPLTGGIAHLGKDNENGVRLALDEANAKGVTIPASAIYNQAGIPMISGSATNPKVTEQGFKVTFRTVGRDDQQGPAIASYLATTVKVKNVAIVDDATAYGKGLAEEVEKTLKAAGVKCIPRDCRFYCRPRRPNPRQINSDADSKAGP